MSKTKKIIFIIISYVVAFAIGFFTMFGIDQCSGRRDANKLITELKQSNEQLRQENAELKERLDNAIGLTGKLEFGIGNAIDLTNRGIGYIDDAGQTVGDIRDTINNIRTTITKLKINYNGIKEILIGLKTDCRNTEGGIGRSQQDKRQDDSNN